MAFWRYTAVPMDAAERNVRSGEMAAATAADVRAALRRIGLQVIDLRPLREPARGGVQGGPFARLVEMRRGYMQRRRIAVRADLYDGLATLLEAGMPLAQALAAVASSAQRGGRGKRSLARVLSRVQQAVSGGEPFDEAIAPHADWFDTAEVAMVRAAVQAGTLPTTLRTLASRHERAAEIGQRLIEALAYPTVVAVVGLAVVLFLSTNTLPQIVNLLRGSGVDPPALTLVVMGFGQWFITQGLLIVPLLIVAVAIALPLSLRAFASSLGEDSRTAMFVRRILTGPAVRRRLAVARLSLQLAELLRCGLPLIEALRIAAPVAGQRDLERAAVAAATRIEHGARPLDAFDDPLWFDEEFRQLVEVGESGGELPAALDRIGSRCIRQASRLIDRLTALLEPAVILLLAALVGIVAMAAVLPLTYLQEMV